MSDQGNFEIEPPLMQIRQGGRMDHDQYFVGVNLDELRFNQEAEMRRIGGRFDEAADRISQIVHFCTPASYRQIFLPPSNTDNIWRNLHQSLVSSPEGALIRKNMLGMFQRFNIVDKYRANYVLLEFIHSSDLQIRQQYDEMIGKKLFENLPPDLVFVSDGFPKVGLVKAEPPCHTNDFCIFDGCEGSWSGGFTVVSETGRLLYLNDGVEHYVRDHHLFEISPPRQAYDQDPKKGKNPAAISPTDFYKLFMRNGG